MNRKLFWLLGIVCVPLVFGACASKPVIFDQNLPLEKSSRLFFVGGLEVTEYNGIPVPHKRVFGATTSEWRDVYLPPGEMEFTLDVYQRIGNFIFTADNVFFRYKFDAGEPYVIFFTRSGGPEKDQWGVEIYNEPPKLGFPSEASFIAFVPFYKR